MSIRLPKEVTLLTFLMCNIYFGWSQIIDIPDANFKNALLNTACADFNGNGVFSSQVDLNNDDEIQLSEALGVQGLRVWNQNIVSVEGLENFINLTYLNVTFNYIETMDISALTNLTDLLCYGNELTALDVSNNLSLENLYCNENQITELDVTLNTNLKNFECYINLLTDLDVTSNVNLETLNCSQNQLSEIDVTSNPLLIWLLASNTNLSVLDITNNPLLESLIVDNNNLLSIDLSQNPNLASVYLSNNLLTEIDISNNPDVFELIVQNNNLSSANIKNGTAFMTYSGFFMNPDLEFICADDFEINAVQTELDVLGYTETVVSDNCDLSVDNYNLEAQVKVFPVPFRDKLCIQSNDRIKKVTVFNCHGQKVLETTSVAMETHIDTELFSIGFYVIKVETIKGVEFKNIIKQ
ncbi:T9SS type A sorting domain-containing protein [Psychroserpens mesophilus]|uniref:T9SS type A sorting domain-containing protein n=1 Tax=Psychroserpens mesophilus TaxID=325473 RepID=UPI003D65675D